MTAPSLPAFCAIWRSGSSRARRTMLTPICSSVSFRIRLEVVEDLAGTNKSDAAAGDDAFFDSSTRCVHCIFDAGLLFLHLGLGRGTDLDHRNTADQFGKTFLQFFTVVVRLVVSSI